MKKKEPQVFWIIVEIKFPQSIKASQLIIPPQAYVQDTEDEETVDVYEADVLDEIHDVQFLDGLYSEVGVTDTTLKKAQSQVIRLFESDPDLSRFDWSLYWEQIGLIEKEDIQKEIFEDEDIKDFLSGNPQDVGVWYVSNKHWYHN